MLDEWSRILRSGVDRILQPLWFIGHSVVEEEVGNEKDE